MIVYLIISISPIAAIALTVWHIHLIGKRNIGLELKQSDINRPYIHQRMRNSPRQEMSKAKSVEKFYKLEQSIKFPQKY